MKLTLGIVLAIAMFALPGAAPDRAAKPVPKTAVSQDSLIRPGEAHLAHLWQLTFGGQNAEGYWSADGTKLIFQSTRGKAACDQMYVMDMKSGRVARVSNGKGRCTCGYFYDQDERIVYASTFLGSDSCPPPPDHSQGYVWAVYPEFELFTSKPDGSDLKRLTDHPGYDAEGTLSPDGQWILFTSLREGDLDLYKMHPDGTELTRLTDRLGYDGGGFFSRDGQWICWRSDYPEDSASVASYRSLLARNLVKPSRMNIWVMRADGSEKFQLTANDGASFAPYFTPDGSGVIYASNWEHPESRNFDLYIVPLNGQGQEPVTRDPSFDSFPMFSPDGQWLVFASNRGGKTPGETNLFLAECRP